MFRSQIQSVRAYLTVTTMLACAAIALPASVRAGDNRAPAVPNEIAVPEGHKVSFHAYAEGVQIYTWNGFTWGASVPEAVLYNMEGDAVGIHYGGPSWESTSGSKVIATLAAPRITVDPNAIPWLLLSAVHTEGPGIFAGTTYLQRVNTVGGKAPELPGTMTGQVARVPYTADYYFFRESND